MYTGFKDMEVMIAVICLLFILVIFYVTYLGWIIPKYKSNTQLTIKMKQDETKSVDEIFYDIHNKFGTIKIDIKGRLE